MENTPRKQRLLLKQRIETLENENKSLKEQLWKSKTLAKKLQNEYEEEWLIKKEMYKMTIKDKIKMRELNIKVLRLEHKIMNLRLHQAEREKQQAKKSLDDAHIEYRKLFGVDWKPKKETK